MTKAVDLTGEKFNSLTAIKRAEANTPAGKAIWSCLCDCGTMVSVTSGHLRSGHTKSCGCRHIERNKGPKYLIHSHARRGAHTPEYRAWRSMINRCTNPNVPNYHSYGGRGITVCESWFDFASFISDMGTRPTGMSLERVNNEMGYSPENCIWATREQQANNRRTNKYITHNGMTQTISQWAREKGIAKDVIGWRLKKGMPVEEILKT